MAQARRTSLSVALTACAVRRTTVRARLEREQSFVLAHVVFTVVFIASVDHVERERRFRRSLFQPQRSQQPRPIRVVGGRVCTTMPTTTAVAVTVFVVVASVEKVVRQLHIVLCFAHALANRFVSVGGRNAQSRAQRVAPFLRAQKVPPNSTENQNDNYDGGDAATVGSSAAAALTPTLWCWRWRDRLL
jgi:hypothetical protein